MRSYHRMERICKGCIYWDGESCLNPKMPDDYWGNLLYGDKGTCDYKETIKRKQNRAMRGVDEPHPTASRRNF
jgi:hypothetical protein